MKTHVSFLLALSQLAAVGHTLSARADSEFDCYAIDAGQSDEHTAAFNSYAACNEHCKAVNRSVFAVRQSNCICLDSLPSDDKKVDASKCDAPCPGFMRDACGGGLEYYTVGSFAAANYSGPNYSGPTGQNDTSPADADSFTYSGAITTATQTTLPSASGVSSNSTSSGSSSVATPSGSASGSSASPSSTVDSTNAAAPIFDASLAVVSSLVGAVALLATLI